MAKFETIVRPVVFPNIRPAPPRSLPPEDDPEQGVAVIRGNPGQSFELSYSYSFSASSSNATETERTVDDARIYQKDDDGNIDRNNFIDVEIAKEIIMEGADLPAASDNESNESGAPKKGRLKWKEKYKPVDEKDNVEIRNRDQVKKNEGA